VNQTSFELIPIGWVESPLTDRASAPKQGHEGSPEAWPVFEPWVLRVHPRGDIANPEQGVCNTRSLEILKPAKLTPL